MPSCGFFLCETLKFFFQHLEERMRFPLGLRRRGLDDEAPAFAPHDRLLARKLERARDPHGLIAAVAEETDVAPRRHGICPVIEK